ncbi:carboxypeptidase regulatory-like domain-containing protein [Gammaproteobacteria bacterium]|nr:carboxypeptidase regulatory-like domain-containing protein [Gammaproteobacteria bacterium]|tara:strand:- start:353 stop:3490 length:3138 start_codon:yes stop_codon:yes gene_type:complete
MKKLLSLIAFSLLFTLPILSEVSTTSSIRGDVNVGSATIAVKNMSTGQTKNITADADGNFSASFLPIGGPYTVSVSAPGYRSESIDGIILILNDITNLNVDLLSSGADLEEVVVTASKGVSRIKIGTGTFLDRQAMDGVPTINRSIADFAKFDPRVSINSASSRNAEISVMGQNNRFNDFSIDGVSFNDPFGLNANGFGSMRNPISLDFVDQISVDVTPYDVSRGNATGGSISVVTKSGSNEFHGSYYTTSRDQENLGEFKGTKFSTFSEDIDSFTFSGPIIKDKLFFFVGYEELEATSPVLFGTLDSNAPNRAETLTTAMADRIKSIALNTYGYEAGEINNISFPETHEEYVVKLDYYINDNHRAVYNKSRSEDLFPRKYNRGNTVFSNNYYTKPPEIDRESISLFSDWSDRLRTKFKYSTYDMYEDDASVGAPHFPESRITVGGDRVYLGGDRYRGANLIKINSEFLSFKVDYDLGDHLITAGYEQEESNIYNLFIARYNGEVHFDSIDDFETGAWSYLRFHTPISGNANVSDAAAAFDLEKTTFYIQDRWNVNDDLSVQYGVRYDHAETPTAARLNPKFLERNGVPNNASFDYDKFQPRTSFTYNLQPEKLGFLGNLGIDVIDSTVRGGYGLFLGRIPNVWYGNQYSRSGGATDYNRFRSYSETIGPMPAVSTGCAADFWWVGPCSTYEVRGAYFGDAQGTDPDFEAPSSWRSNIALDFVTAGGTAVTLELNKDEVEEGVFYKDLQLRDTGTTRADGRKVYSSASPDLWLTNSSQGSSEAYSFTISKSFGNLNAMYAFSSVDAKDVYPLTSAQAEGVYGNTQRYDGENLDARPSNFMIDSKSIFSLDYTTQLIGQNDTRFSLVYVQKSGEKFSVVYDEVGYNSVGGSPNFYSDNSLPYIPTGITDPNVVFTSSAVATSVMAHINRTALADYKGTYAPRNAFEGPKYSKLDLRITQDFTVYNDHKVILYFDFLNIMNYLDEDKGHVEEYSGNSSKQIILGGATGVDDQGRYIIAGVDPDDNLTVFNSNGQSVWQMNLGFKYQF